MIKDVIMRKIGAVGSRKEVVTGHTEPPQTVPVPPDSDGTVVRVNVRQTHPRNTNCSPPGRYKQLSAKNWSALVRSSMPCFGGAP
jgi:hypothetical protein